MAAENWLGINLGDIIGQTEQIKAAQQARQINDFRMQQAQQEALQQQQDREQLGQLLPKAAAGDTQAINQVAGINPELWAKLDDHQRQLVAQHTDEIGQAIAYADTPQKWDQVVDYLSPKNPELAKYKGHFELRAQAAMQVGAMKQFIESQKVAWHPIGEGGMFATDQAGNPIGSGNPFAAASVNGQPQTTAPARGGFANAVAQVLSHEGGYNAHDMNGKPVNFGINQGANPDINVKNLTRDQAIQLYHDRYWVPSGAENLPANMQAPYFDVYIRNPAAAKRAWAQSGGDPQKFMQIAQAYFGKLGTTAAGAPYAKAWANRDAQNLAVATGGQPQTLPNGLPATAAPGYIPGVQKPAKDAPSGYQWNPAHTALQAIPGGPADTSVETTPLNNNSIDYVAQQYMATGQLPPLGMGKQAAAMRAQIIGRAAQMSQQQGITGTQAAGLHADFKANQAALSTLQRNSNQVLAYERTALANAQQVLQTMGKGAAQTGMPIFNSWVQAGRRSVAGNPDVARFDLAIQTFATEYARVVSGATGGAVTSDSARKEITDRINAAQTPQQIAAVINQAQVEMANRRKGLMDQAGALRQALGAQPASPAASSGWGHAQVIK